MLSNIYSGAWKTRYFFAQLLFCASAHAQWTRGVFEPHVRDENEYQPQCS